MFTITHEDKSARVGKLKTQHGIIETPFFMPVATKMSAKLISPHDLLNANTQALICNAYLISVDPGVSFIEKTKGIHNFMNFHNIIFTDSGGFQIIVSGFQATSTDKGILFKSPINGKEELLTPEHAIDIQNKLNADVIMCLDDVPHFGKSYEATKEATLRTFEFAKRCKASHKNKKQLLFGIAQGSIFPDLREKSAQQINALDFDGFALGGLSIGEDKKTMHQMIDITLNHINREKPVYFMGLGSPKDILDAIEKGIDIFDSAYPTRIARHEIAFTTKENIELSKAKFKYDNKPIIKECSCEACQNYSRAYIHHLIKIKEPLWKRLLSLHNIHFLNNLLEEARTAIKEQTLHTFKKNLYK